jgi:hypothetical protein
MIVCDKCHRDGRGLTVATLTVERLYLTTVKLEPYQVYAACDNDIPELLARLVDESAIGESRIIRMRRLAEDVS